MRSPKTVSLISIAAFVALVVAAGSALGANGSCPNGLPVCFAQNTPAVASDVNLNFAQLKEWLEAKLGPLNSATVTSGTMNVTTLGANTVTTGSGGATITVMNGYSTSCFPGTSSGLNVPVSCCRMNMRDGTATCRQASNQTLASWSADISTPFTAQTAGWYTISCFSGESGYNFPGCCRTNVNTGGVVCYTSQAWNLSSWYAASTAF